MDGPKRLRLEDESNDAEDPPLNLSLTAVKVEYPSACLSPSEMRSKFQQWVLKTYRDASKTKTITAKKYERIVKTLAGEIKNCAENSKFRFWMKCKGFKLDATSEGNGPSLLVQDRKGDDIKYKKVAIVENFFDIIYDVHVNEGARGIKHAGQKRTHRVITETYAFLPREAVTRFLLCCTDCQKRLNEDRKHSPNSSSCDSTQPQPTDLPDFQSQPHTVDQFLTVPSSPAFSTKPYLRYGRSPSPVVHSKDCGDEPRDQPYDYSTRCSSPDWSASADTIRKQRKRKVTSKLVRLDGKCETKNTAEYGSSKADLHECAAKQKIAPTQAAEQIYKNITKTENEDEPHQYEYNGTFCKRQCPFIEKISEVLYNPVKYAMNAERQNDFPTNEDFLEQSAVDLLLKARHLETMKEVLTDHDREQILLKIYSCRIISFLLSYAADTMLRLMIDDQISS